MRSMQAEWRSEFPSTLEHLEQFFADFKVWRETTCVQLEAFPIELLLREAMTNAVVHGCLEDSNKRIRFALRVKPGRLVAAIRDEGPGFDWRAMWNRPPDDSDTHGRGMEILRGYASAVRFNPRGNAVTLIKRFDGEQHA